MQKLDEAHDTAVKSRVVPGNLRFELTKSGALHPVEVNVK
jgi:hypothetical protein